MRLQQKEPKKQSILGDVFGFISGVIPVGARGSGKGESLQEQGIYNTSRTYSL
jgi:hypothetical protein